MDNAILIQNMNTDELKSLIGEAVENKLQSFNPKPQPKEKYLTRHETAKALRVSLPTLNVLTKTGKIAGYRIGGRVLYKETDVDTSLKQIVTSKFRR